MPVLDPSTIISTLLKSKSAHEHTHHSKFVVIKSTRCDLTSSGLFLIVADCSELSPSYRGTLPQELRLPPLPYSANWSGSLVHGTTNLGMNLLFSPLEMLPINGSPVGASYLIPSLQEVESVFQGDTFLSQSEIPKTSNDQFRGPWAKLLSLVTISSRSGIAACH